MADTADPASESAPDIEQGKDNVLSTSASKAGNGMSKALLLEEYPNMSTAVHNLVSSLDNPTVEEIVIALLYILVVETGFVPYPSEPMPGDETCQYNARRLKTLVVQPKNCRDSQGFYQAFFTLPPVNKEKCKLVCVPVGSCVVANMYSSCSSKSFAMAVNPPDYVTLYPEEIIFKRLASLSLSFKSQVVVPIRTVMFNEIHQTTVGLFALPVEVLLKLIGFLKVNDFLMLSSTCKYFFHTFSYDERIWKRFCLLKFNKLGELAVKETHREYYRRKMNFRNRVSFRVSHLQTEFPLALPEL